MSLSPSQRIILITKISKRLGSENWSLIDLTLKQFALPWTNDWTGTSIDYVQEMIEKAPDQVMLELAQHVGFDCEVSPSSQIEPAFWRKGMFRLFISHLAIHREWAGELQEALLPYGISSFVAHNDIEPTTEW